MNSNVVSFFETYIIKKLHDFFDNSPLPSLSKKEGVDIKTIIKNCRIMTVFVEGILNLNKII